MIVAQRIPVWDIPCCSGVIVEDVLSPRGALLVPKGKNLSKMGDSRFSFAATLEYQGISYVTVKESVDFALGEVLEVLESLRIPSDPTDSVLALHTVREVEQIFTAIAAGKSSKMYFVPLLRVGKLLAQCIIRNPRILLSLGNVREQDHYTFVHSFNVALLGGFLAYRLFPENRELVKAVTTGGLLHDLGKARLPLSILNKPGRLSEKEFKEVKKHPVYGAQIARQLDIKNENILAVIESHHERMDGTGYPYGLKAEEIPLAARIAAVADVFDALTTVRVYKGSVPLHKAVSIILEEAESQFDKTIVAAFLDAVGMYPPGTMVQLSDNRVGMVLTSGEKNAAKPRVLLKTDEEGNKYEEHAIVDLSENPHIFIHIALDHIGKRKDSLPIQGFDKPFDLSK